MDWYEITQRSMRRINEETESKIKQTNAAIKAISSIVSGVSKGVETKEAKIELDEYAKTENFIYDKKVDRYYSTTGEGADFKIAQVTTPQMKLHKDLTEAHGSGSLSDEVWIKDETGVITGINEKYITNLTEKDINRLQTIDPWKGPDSNFASNESIQLWEGYTPMASFDDEGIISSFVEDQQSTGKRQVIDAADFENGQYKFKGNIKKGTYIDRQSTDGDNYIEYFNINGTTRPVLVNEKEYYLLNSGRYNRDEVEESIKNTTKANAENAGEEWPKIDDETGLPKFDGGTTAMLILAAVGFLSGASQRTQQMKQQKRAARKGIKGIKSEFSLMQQHGREDKESMIDKYNRSVSNLTKQFQDTSGEFQGQLEGSFKASRGLASTQTTGLKENALRSLTDAFGTKAGDLTMDFDQNYDKYMRNFEKEHNSKQMQIRDLYSQYKFAKKRDSFWDNII